MKRLTEAEVERLAQAYGHEVPGLKPELEAKFRELIASDNDEASLSPPPFAKSLRVISRNLELTDEDDFVSERIVALAAGARPVARIRDNQATTEFLGPDSQSWAEVIRTSRDLINRAIPAVGRIELNNSDYPWAGTGWLVADGIIVTNRHVAEVFAKLDSTTSRFVFKAGLLSGVVSSDIDFLEEENRLDSAEHPITSILWMAPSGESDVAFLRVTRAEGGLPLPRPIELADDTTEGATIAAIGYPARDPSIRDQELVVSIFGDDVYDKKRLSPGKVMTVEGVRLKHDCSTLGGNSGSVLLDLKTGKAVGIHHGGLTDDSANLGVTASHIRTLMENVIGRDIPRPTEPTTQLRPPLSDQPLLEVSAAGVYRVKLQIPIEIFVKVGVPEEIPSPGAPNLADSLEAALENAKQRFGANPDVLKISTGYRFKNGWITDERVIVIEVRQKFAFGELAAAGKTPFPREILGVGIDVRTAPLTAQLAALGVDLAALERPGQPGRYTEPPGYADPNSEMFLARINDERMDAIFHVSPDAGFPNLKAFLKRVRTHLTATMYEWEPNHISDVIEEVMRPAGRTLRMVTQKRGVGEGDATESAVEDMKDRIGAKFKHVWASVRGPKRLIPNSYHIKVASRDGEEVWLSSGNWKDSNQPEDPTNANVLRKFNREWHAIIKNDRLATQFQKYIEYDFRQAQRFPLEEREARAFADIEFFIPDYEAMLASERVPAARYESELVITNELLDIQPLLTPDRDGQGNRMFMKFATEMIQRATKTIFIQNQSFTFTKENNKEFDKFFKILKEKQRTIDDVRVIFRDARDYGRPGDLEDQQELIQRLKDFGLDVSPDAMRLQSKCHTKGIIVDSKEALVGSQNLTNGGSLFNRDASLLLRSRKVAAFFEKIFLFDWEHLAHNEADEHVGGIRRALPGEETPIGFRRVTLSELLNMD